MIFSFNYFLKLFLKKINKLSKIVTSIYLNYYLASANGIPNYEIKLINYFFPASFQISNLGAR